MLELVIKENDYCRVMLLQAMQCQGCFLLTVISLEDVSNAFRAEAFPLLMNGKNAPNNNRTYCIIAEEARDQKLDVVMLTCDRWCNWFGHILPLITKQVLLNCVKPMLDSLFHDGPNLDPREAAKIARDKKHGYASNIHCLA